MNVSNKFSVIRAWVWANTQNTWIEFWWGQKTARWIFVKFVFMWPIRSCLLSLSYYSKDKNFVNTRYFQESEHEKQETHTHTKCLTRKRSRLSNLIGQEQLHSLSQCNFLHTCCRNYKAHAQSCFTSWSSFRCLSAFNHGLHCTYVRTYVCICIIWNTV